MQNIFSQSGLKIELMNNERILLYEININDDDCTTIHNDNWNRIGIGIGNGNGSNNDNECNNNNSCDVRNCNLTNKKMQSYSRALSKCYCNKDNVVCNETYLSLTLQIFFPFVIAGFGMVGAGLLLDDVQHYTVFEEVTELMILIPAMLGLKGNLEMTLASRLSTQANLGNLDKSRDKWNMISKNLVLIQCQAIICGFIGSIAATIMGLMKSSSYNIKTSHFLLLCASSLITITASSLILGVVTVIVILLSRKYSINPDNVATPITAAIGDLTSLFILSQTSSALHHHMEDWIAPLIILIFLLIITPLLLWISMKSSTTKKVLHQGWLPIMTAMLISLTGGYILDNMVEKFASIAVFQPVINGVGGNLVAVQASRISTSLHKAAAQYIYEKIPFTNSESQSQSQSQLRRLSNALTKKSFIKYSKSPLTIFFDNDTHSKTARALLSLVIPGHLIFVYSINNIKSNTSALTANFVIIYLFVAIFQVSVLLYIAKIMICWMWNNQIDPDNSAIPYLTSFGDLLGISLLAIAFQLLYFFGERDNI